MAANGCSLYNNLSSEKVNPRTYFSKQNLKNQTYFEKRRYDLDKFDLEDPLKVIEEAAKLGNWVLISS